MNLKISCNYDILNIYSEYKIQTFWFLFWFDGFVFSYLAL